MSTLGRPWDSGMQVVLYGAAPQPDSPRNPFDDLQPLGPGVFPESIPTPEPKPVESKLAAHHQFEWHGVTFIWVTGNRFFGEAIAERGWRGSAYPDGTRWQAEIELCGGKRCGAGAGPIEALEAAYSEWVVALGKLGTP